MIGQFARRDEDGEEDEMCRSAASRAFGQRAEERKHSRDQIQLVLIIAKKNEF